MNSLFILGQPLPPFQYSLDNEAERQKLEHEAERLRGGGLGGQRRAQHVEALRRVEAELEGINLGNSNSTSPSTRSGGSSLRMADPASSMMMRPPRSSANLEQLYHEALPSPPILSNSGPPNLVYSSASNLFHQVCVLDLNGNVGDQLKIISLEYHYCLTLAASRAKAGEGSVPLLYILHLTFK